MTHRRTGLYDPSFEHDACGLAFVASLSGRPDHQVVCDALMALRNLEHRGAAGADAGSGDGAGITVQIPDALLRSSVDFDLPAAGEYAVGAAFLPRHDTAVARAVVESHIQEQGLRLLGWRTVPVDVEVAGATSRSTMPLLEQVFVARAGLSGIGLDRACFTLRRRIEHGSEVYFASWSARTLVYKGMLTAPQVGQFFLDLGDPRFATALAVVHARFSTNTFPTWSLAHPFRMLAHNGEINTIRGNRNWMRARESTLSSDLLGPASDWLPVCTEGASDSATLDEVIELLALAGRSLPHAVLMTVPEAWENQADMDPDLRSFYAYHATLMEPWDGPACVAFTDGTVVGAVLDRNGLRPGRYWVTASGTVVFASEVGVLDISPGDVVAKGRLQPGRMLLVDTAAGRIVDDAELKASLASRHPFREWVDDGVFELADLPGREHVVHTHASVRRRQQTFGYTEEELRLVLAPMACGGTEALGAMGDDTPVAALSERPRLLFDYFTQMFAQVTNPPLDAIREELVTSVASFIGAETNLLEADPRACRQVRLDFPVIDNDDLAKLLHIDADGAFPDLRAAKVRGLFAVAEGEPGLERRLHAMCAEVSQLVTDGVRFIVLSDRDSDARLAPIPSLLMVSAIHHHLVRTRQRTQASLLVEAGDVREAHHVALLVGYGAAAVNPYLAMESVEDLARAGDLGETSPDEAVHRLLRALGKGVLKVMSKMGVSTVASYRGSQLFEAVGLGDDLVDTWFTGTPSRLGGMGLTGVCSEVLDRHRVAYPVDGAPGPERLAAGSEYEWRRDGERHLFDPETVFRLQHATRQGRVDLYRQYSAHVDEETTRRGTLRGMLRLRTGVRPPVPLDEVEPAEQILRRFATGAMSYGSISPEAHETLAIAMNRIGGRSNTGEGGEEPDRLSDPARRSAIKQIASGRFGVTSEYLVNATDLQIKMAQGAKPGEGGQLPGRKVYPWIARTRHSTPGVGLISPPPHHDIYSIEDLAQLIDDLRHANPLARIHVKLVSEIGVGTVAAGVAKAAADVVLVSGHDGGTGAAPLTSIKHAGTPWELGLAETQQTLLRNGLRDRIVVQVDGQLRTGRDVLVAALLGAEEYGFATTPLVVMGCVMMRACHQDTCPVGIATQDPVLRERFTGAPELVEQFFRFLADEVRELLASLGLRSLDEAIGRVELLETDTAVRHWKAAGLDLAPLLAVPDLPESAARRHTAVRPVGEPSLDERIARAVAPRVRSARPVRVQREVRNTDRSVGARVGWLVTREHGGAGLPADTVELDLSGSAGQSLGAFLPPGVTVRLEGDANDYVGKGLSGGRIVLRPPAQSPFAAERNVIAGNVVLYGATGGELFVRGVVGERFAVRNSGAVAVVEGVGDHACEYMTGGQVVILGATGRNLAAGMTGGVAHVLDLLPERVNHGDVELTEPDGGAAGWLRDVIDRHRAETGSVLAAALLADWPRTQHRFTTIVPTQFRRVCELVSAAEADGRDPDVAVMAAAAAPVVSRG
ncbi:MAG: glutamate synthase large subunit [Actinomycetota bacterium]|nr:glutamate synthase large subunit [Actinomycetota bacterium]MDH4352370.1 glutamate synthase large subunit [Actinomycetota bacterium]